MPAQRIDHMLSFDIVNNRECDIDVPRQTRLGSDRHRQSPNDRESSIERFEVEGNLTQ